MNKTPITLHLRLRQSQLLIRYQHLTHAAILAYCLAATSSLPIMILPLLIVVLSWLRFWVQSFQSVGFNQTITWRSSGAWEIHEEGEKVPLRFSSLDHYYSSRWLTLLGFKKGLFRCHYLLILSDNSESEAWRRLRVRLKQAFNQ
ncbi:MAG: hypothetical protein OQL27_00675 [Sedimenticola sp.]|nr:hypothetical protein [Sedimenticola sp.]